MMPNNNYTIYCAENIGNALEYRTGCAVHDSIPIGCLLRILRVLGDERALVTRKRVDQGSFFIQKYRLISRWAAFLVLGEHYMSLKR